MDSSTPGLPVHHQLMSLLKLMSIELVIPYSHLILCRPLLLLPPILPSIRVFSNESTLRVRWPKYWSFSFSVSPSKESGLPFPSPVDLILSDLSTMTRPSWVAPHAWLSFIELDQAVVPVIRLASFL